MHQDLIRGYKNFLAGSIKVYFFGEDIVQTEIEKHTKGFLKDGLFFFICAFDKVDNKLLKRIKLIDEDALKEYVDTNNKFVLTTKGEELKFYLSQKLEAQALMLEFNGIKPEYVGKITTILKRFEKFWQVVLGFSKKSGD